MSVLGGVLLDSVIVIDAFNGIAQAESVVRENTGCAISVITWIEVMAGAKNDAQRELLRTGLKTFDLIAIDPAIAELAAAIRQERKLRLPDAIIFATARHRHLTLVTRNTKDFKPGTRGVRIPYQLS